MVLNTAATEEDLYEVGGGRRRRRLKWKDAFLIFLSPFLHTRLFLIALLSQSLYFKHVVIKTEAGDLFFFLSVEVKQYFQSSGTD